MSGGKLFADVVSAASIPNAKGRICQSHREAQLVPQWADGDGIIFIWVTDGNWMQHDGWTGGVSPVFTGLLLGLGGVGWDVNVHVTLMMLRSSSGVGVGWGGMLTFMLR